MVFAGTKLKQKKDTDRQLVICAFCKKRLIVLSIFINSWKVDQIFLAQQKKTAKTPSSQAVLIRKKLSSERAFIFVLAAWRFLLEHLPA